jgi:hypothetical protein
LAACGAQVAARQQFAARGVLGAGGLSTAQGGVVYFVF